MDDKDFVFSLYPNDLIRIVSKQDMELGKVNPKSDLPDRLVVPRGDGVFLYYKGFDRSAVSIAGITHDNTYKHRSIGKTMQLIEKYDVDMLGNVHKVGKEKRMGYSMKKNKEGGA